MGINEQLQNMKRLMAINEAYELSMAREYTSMSRNPAIQERLNYIFQRLGNISGARSSKKGERVYVPHISDGNKLIVFSNHPYDIAGMSTGRSWSSCMNLYKGYNKKFVSNDIQEGTFIFYIIYKDDLNIKDPIGRGLVKPYIDTDNPDNVHYLSSRKGYELTSEESNYVYGLINLIQDSNPKTIFKFNSKLYCHDYDDIQDYSKNFQERDGFIKDKGEIEFFLESNLIINYKINDDLSVDVFEDVTLSEKGFLNLPIQFNHVDGYFTLSHNRLTTLKGAPRSVSNSFNCVSNNLKSLEHGPVEVMKNYYAGKNLLENTNGFPKLVGENFSLSKQRNGKIFTEKEVLSVTEVHGEIDF